MLSRDSIEEPLELMEFDLEGAIAAVKEGQPLIPVWLDAIHQHLARRLRE